MRKVVQLASMKQKITIVVGITSGIAAYKMVELVELLKKENNDVVVVMTRSAAKMVSPTDFEKASGNKVHIELFEDNFDYKDILKNRKVDHIAIADKADIFVVAPATANTIAKIANGLADDFLTTSILATQAPILICPSMNVHMYENVAVQENIEKLRSRGFFILEPESGDLACGYHGKGRLAHIFHIKDEITTILENRARLKGKKILITSGGTKEPIDGVRFITNKSSGKMGVAIAEVCFAMGADVLLLRAKDSVIPSKKISEEVFETAEDLEGLVRKYITSYDVIFHTAAVSDFIVGNPQKGKISSDKETVLRLEPAKKIISTIKKLNPNIKLIGFKAVWGGSEKELVNEGKKKLEESNADAIVANDVSKSDRGFQSDNNEVIIVTKNTSKNISLRSKKEVAQDLIQYLLT